MAQSLVSNTPEHWQEQFDTALDLDDAVALAALVGTRSARITPTGAINSTTGSDGNGAYTLPDAPYPVEDFQLFKNGLLVPSSNYTLLNNSITYVAGQYPTSGDTHEAIYSY